jgi:eukaryotic-like serine/threonine-protein kinase
MIAAAQRGVLDPGTVLAGKFRIERVLGRGGMAVVVEAWHLTLRQRVALKFLTSVKDSATLERFIREARAVVRLQSDHVVKVYDVATTEDGHPFIVMEALDGKDLGAVLEERSSGLAVADAVDHVLQAIDAIAEAHALGIIHRDLKPSNLFVARRADGEELVKVLDFGISKLEPGLEGMKDKALTNTAAVVGSPLYMSPEQIRSAKKVDARTDIWSLGVILYELLMRVPPFEGETVGEVLSNAITATPAPMRTLRPDVPPDLEQAILRCLAKDRNERWSNVSDLAKQLAPHGSRRSHRALARALSIVPPSDPSLPRALDSNPATTSVSTPGALPVSTLGRTAPFGTPPPVEAAAATRSSSRVAIALVALVGLAGIGVTAGVLATRRSHHARAMTTADSAANVASNAALAPAPPEPKPVESSVVPMASTTTTASARRTTTVARPPSVRTPAPPTGAAPSPAPSPAPSNPNIFDRH